MKNQTSKTIIVDAVPFMPMPYNLHYSIKWWTQMSVGGVECLGGSFNLELYMAIVNRELYNHPDSFETIEKKPTKSLTDYIKSFISKFSKNGNETI